MAGARTALVFGLWLVMALLASPPLQAEKVSMLGDSLTAEGNWPALLPEHKMYNFGVSGETSEQIGRRAAEAARPGPDYIFLLAGINDFYPRGGRNPVDRIVAAQLRLWAEVEARLPKGRLVVQSLLPVSEEKFPPSLNRDIREVNRRLRLEAEKRGLGFLDLYEALADSSGRLPAELTYDGLHLKAAGYGKWAELIRSYLKN